MLKKHPGKITGIIMESMMAELPDTEIAMRSASVL
jgi:hypothetical protein